MTHAVYIVFVFALGACVGSFLNVVVWRLPRIEINDKDGFWRSLFRTIDGLSNPPSHCPKCNQPIRWYDNLPVVGWIKLGGKCRFCKASISARYPIVEAITGLLFVFYYVMFFIMQIGPCAAQPHMIDHPTLGAAMRIAQPLSIFQDWPIYALYMAMIAALLAASLIDAELFIIPIEIPWVIGIVGAIAHAIIDRPSMPGAVIVQPAAGALAAGGLLGLIISLTLWKFGVIPVSFPEGEPMQDVPEMPAGSRVIDQPPPPRITRKELNRELRKEMMFLLPPMVLAAVCWFVLTRVPAAQAWWKDLFAYHWIGALLGSVLGALVGGFTVWVTRILGTLVFGRLAMGLGDVHLMLGVGAVVGAGGATIAFFLAPFFGIAIAIYMLLSGTRRELPYGPYLSLATAFVLLFCCPIMAYLTPGMMGLAMLLREATGH